MEHKKSSPGLENAVFVSDETSDAQQGSYADERGVSGSKDDNSSVSSISNDSERSILKAVTRGPGLLNSRHDKNATSEFSAFFNLLKANIGTGMLALPQAFFYAGVWVALVMTPLIGIIATHCMHLLLESSRLLCARINAESLSYEETMNAAFITGPEKLRPITKFMTIATKAFICTTQIGFVCVYYEFVCENLYQLIECNPSMSLGLTLVDYKLILFIPFLLVCSATELKVIGYMSITSCALFVAAIAIILYYCTRDLQQYPVGDLPAFGGWKTFPLYFGTIVFAVEGIGCMLPIENRMADPSNFSGIIGVLNTCMVIVVCLYTGIGFFGYVRYREDVQGAITLNLPSDEV
ncbi:hypothetical protein HAZT_HAZT009166 [Hyalella azteca]|nr:hypothetical protein HAZT_HAZT009166 [Hyalella azteca]